MKGQYFPALIICLCLLGSSACASDRAAADPNAPPGTAQPTAPPPAATGGAQNAPGTPPSPTAAGQGATSPAPAPVNPDLPAVRVNGAPILNKEVGEAIADFLRNQGAPPNLPQEQMQQVHQMVVDALIGRELLFQKAKAEGITAMQPEIDAVIAESRKGFPTEEAWQQSLKQQGLDTVSLNAAITRSILIDKGIKQLVLDKIVISDGDLKTYYDAHPDEMRKPEEVHASHILFKVPESATPESKAPIRKKADDTLAKVKAGEDFAKLARENSEDPGSAPNGGDLGFFRRGQMVGPFEDAAFALTIGQISGIVETQYGYHIIKVTEKHEAGTASLQEVSDPLRNFLKQKQAREKMQSLLSELRATAKVEIL